MKRKQAFGNESVGLPNKHSLSRSKRSGAEGTGKCCESWTLWLAVASEGPSNAQSRGKEHSIRDDTRDILYYVQHSETNMRDTSIQQQSPRIYPV